MINKPPFTKLLGSKATGTFFPTHKHLKSDGLYMLHGAAIVQTAKPLADNQVVVIYEAQDGRLFVRPRDEFYDGRFKTLAEKPKP
jgi:hypothetical protein